jgi:uncharacterized protein (TIGR02391 family)
MTKLSRRLSLNQKLKLKELAYFLQDFLPMQSQFTHVTTFKSIFKESKISVSLSQHSIKVKELERVWIEVYRNHPRLPKTIIRKIIPAAIDHRRYKGKPLTQEDLKHLSQILFDLGIDMKQELMEIKLAPNKDKLASPNLGLIDFLKKYDLHLLFASEPFDLYQHGHTNEAIRKSTEIIEDTVRKLSGNKETGFPLMSKEFKDDRYIDLSNIKESNQKDFIQGYQHLMMGMMSAIRNILSHSNENIRSPEEAFELLMFLNWLMRYLKKKDIESQ